MQDNAEDGFSGLQQWAEPIIFDRILETYGAHVSDLNVAWRLARLHSRVWRALIEGDLADFERRRGDLMSALYQARLDLDHVAEADARTLQELLGVVIDRFHRTPRISMSYHLALLDLASRLAPSLAPTPLAA